MPTTDPVEGEMDLEHEPRSPAADERRGATARILLILRSFDHEFPAGTVKELAERTGIPSSSLFRLMRRLRDAGMLSHDQATGRFAPGIKLLELGDIALRQLRVPDAVQRSLDALQQMVEENASLGIWRGGNTRTCVAVSHSSNTLREFTAVGETYDLWHGAAGKVIAANLPDGIRDTLMAAAAATPPARPQLADELDRIRQAGYAVTDSERIPGVTAVAAPVHDGRSWLGSLAVSGPTFRMAPKVAGLVPIVRRSARELADVLASFG